MKSLKKRRRIQVIVLTFVALAVATVLIGYAMKDGINLYRSPTQLLEDPPRESEVFRLGGVVVEGSLVRGEGEIVHFVVTDYGVEVPVAFSGILPDLFGEGQSMIGTGNYVNNVFQATEILAKHDESYMPREVIDSLKEQGVYVDPDA
ncbi:MAG: cytochrome c maturation protein CcmE [Rhodobacteraceae bacterium]|nr:cytochrome c maturation protein CcmE [Paracoccaceae bacterium]